MIAQAVGTLGGWGLAVSRYSKNPDVAAELALWLTGPEGQKRFCLLGTYAPSLVSLFDDPEITAANPAAVLDIFTNAVPRPAALAGAKYARLSAEFFNTVHAILSKRERPEAGLGTLERNLNRLAKDGWGE